MNQDLSNEILNALYEWRAKSRFTDCGIFIDEDVKVISINETNLGRFTKVIIEGAENNFMFYPVALWVHPENRNKWINFLYDLDIESIKHKEIIPIVLQIVSHLRGYVNCSLYLNKEEQKLYDSIDKEPLWPFGKFQYKPGIF